MGFLNWLMGLPKNDIKPGDYVDSHDGFKIEPVKQLPVPKSQTATITVRVDSEEFKKLPNPIPPNVTIVFEQIPIQIKSEPKPQPMGDVVALKQNHLLADAAIKEAEKFLGTKELTNNNDGKTVNMFQAFVGDSTGEPWCAAFRSYCDFMAATRMGIKTVLPKTDSSTFLYSWAKDHGYLLKAPVAGCIALEKGSGGAVGKTHCHTCRVIQVNADGTFKSIDGNWDNSVCYPSPMHKIANFDFVACC